MTDYASIKEDVRASTVCPPPGRDIQTIKDCCRQIIMRYITGSNIFDKKGFVTDQLAKTGAKYRVDVVVVHGNSIMDVKCTLHHIVTGAFQLTCSFLYREHPQTITLKDITL